MADVYEFPDLLAMRERRQRQWDYDVWEQDLFGLLAGMFSPFVDGDALSGTRYGEFIVLEAAGEPPDSAAMMQIMANRSAKLAELLQRMVGDRPGLAMLVAAGALEILERDADEQTRANVAALRPAMTAVSRALRAG